MASNIRVLYSFPGRVGYPGIGMTAFYQISTLIQKGVEVYLCCGSCEKKIDNLSLMYETFKFAKFKIPMRIFGYRASFIHDRIVAHKLSTIKEAVNAIHTWPCGSLNTLMKAKQLGIKTFLERPNTHTEFAYEVVKREYEKLGIPMPRKSSHTYNKMVLHREIKEYAATVFLLCPSDFVKKTFTERGFDEKKIRRHQYGYDPSIFVFKPHLHEKDDQFSVVFVGTCEPRKGLHYALKAWLDSDASKHGSFIICGGFISDEYRKYLSHSLAHPSIKYLGFQKDVLPYLQKSHALILPTIEEGSALVTYEARAAGCVLLVSKASGALCQDGYDSLVHNVGDTEMLTKHIDLLFSDSSCCQTMRRQCLQSAKEMTWLNAAEVLIDIYRGTRK